MTPLLLLAERVEGLGNVICPFCGEDDFDLPGLAYHIAYYCDVHQLAINHQLNGDIASALRARAAMEAGK